MGGGGGPGIIYIGIIITINCSACTGKILIYSLRGTSVGGGRYHEH